MLPLDQDLQKGKDSLTGFEYISKRVLNYLPNVISSVERKGPEYYLDPPPNALKKPYSDHMKKFSELVSVDIKKLLSS